MAISYHTTQRLDTVEPRFKTNTPTDPDGPCLCLQALQGGGKSSVMFLTAVTPSHWIVICDSALSDLREAAKCCGPMDTITPNNLED
jgi:hypothetical protein